MYLLKQYCIAHIVSMNPIAFPMSKVISRI